MLVCSGTLWSLVSALCPILYTIRAFICAHRMSKKHETSTISGISFSSVAVFSSLVLPKIDMEVIYIVWLVNTHIWETV